jgi:phenylacetate-CoA ligase
MISITPLEAWIGRKIIPVGDPGRLTSLDIRRFQLERINWTLSYAREKSPFYREHFETLGQAPLKRLEDLTAFPFTTPADVGLDPLRFLCVSQSEIERVVTLPSATGQPKRFFFTAGELDNTVDFFQYGMSTLVKPGDKVLILMPGQAPFSIGDLLQRALARMGVDGIVHGPLVDPAQTLRFIIDHEIDSLVGIPTQVLALARTRGATVPEGTIKSVLLSSDTLAQTIAQAIEDVWRCEVFDHYGMTEMGWGGGVECAAHRGYHLREADLYVEIVDPETVEPLSDGETGEVVFTTLNRRGMPLIRYRTGDAARFRRTPCPCGTVLRTLALVGSRLGSAVEIAPGVTLTMSQLDEALFPLSGIVDFSVEIFRNPEARRFSLEVVHNGEGSLQLLANAVVGRLTSIAPIGAALDTGLFKIDPIRFRDMGTFPVAFRKRRIAVRP